MSDDQDHNNGAASSGSNIGVVIIGRNEGERLVACLNSVGSAHTVVYVDSGSTDGSVEAARAAGADVVALDMSLPFTAARARNAGYSRLKDIAAPAYVQFIDGDCELAPGWIDKAAAFLDAHSDYAVACGRCREKCPEASIFNRQCDREWATPIGDTLACGGIAMMRASAFSAVGGFDRALIAGEEPELCLRLREKDWRIMRLDEEMARHDAAIKKLSQWWRRAVRAGHAFAEVSHMHKTSPKRIWAAETRRAVLWSAVAPAALLAALLVHPAALLLLLLYPLQIARLAFSRGGAPFDWADAALLTFGKFAEAWGVLKYHANRITGAKTALIEHKT
ncbi:glycosyltransferase family 2 protein [Hyphococcus luteus]|uniref:Glycosyl transferase n=1 Tax=Hyphococcus luteus TaxID=2058213 RepID=A0A2S7K796_9PROT|nr:glycosyltransferase [Marinicaulis flavus]PQA88394.1 glycosyl transferase [Marinicaulis flavus]